MSEKARRAKMFSKVASAVDRGQNPEYALQEAGYEVVSVDLDYPFLKTCRALWKAMNGDEQTFRGRVDVAWTDIEYIIFNLDQEGYKIVPTEKQK